MQNRLMRDQLIFDAKVLRVLRLLVSRWRLWFLSLRPRLTSTTLLDLTEHSLSLSYCLVQQESKVVWMAEIALNPGSNVFMLYSRHYFHPLSRPIVIGGLGPHLTQCSLGPQESAPQARSQSIQPFLHSTATWQTMLQDPMLPHILWQMQT